MSPITLEGNLTRLEPLALTHLDGIKKAASDGELWKLFFTTVPAPATSLAWFDKAMQQQEQGVSLPFAVIDRIRNQLVGSTRYCNIDSANKRLEIGYTWYAKPAQRSGVNTECKLLLLTHAFETLECNAVEFRTDFFNKKSQAAIERLGAKRDGILRSHIILPDGRVRDTVVYSILKHEWQGVKMNLEFFLAQARSTPTSN